MGDDFIHVTCPDCKNILVVNRRTGELVEVRRPLVEESTGDRFEDAKLKVQRQQSELEKKFEEAKERERRKMERLNQLFNEGLKQAREEGSVSRPERDIDLY